ncbi:MAG: ABC transporter ATP-binding protein [Candidatus Omnitrophota bacterium]
MKKINKQEFRLFLKFLKYLLPYRKKGIIILFLSGVSVLLGVALPYLSKLAVDKGIIGKELKSFIIFGAIGTGLFIINGLVNAVSALFKRSVNLRVNFDLNKKVFSHLQNLPLNFFQNRSTGEHMFRVNYDIDRVVDLVVSIPEEIIKIFPRMLFILAIIFYLNWQMALFALVLAPIMYLPVHYVTFRMRKILEELLTNSQDIFKRMEEVFSHIHLVKALGKEKAETRSYLKALIARIKIRLRNVRLEVFGSFAGGSCERIIIGLITLFGGYLVIKEQMTAGTLAAIMIYLGQLIGLQNSVAFFFQRVVMGLVSCNRLNEVLQENSLAPEIGKPKVRIIFDNPRIEFKKVRFGYCEGEDVLRDIEFNLEKGVISLAGLSGCGKTTILNLILGIYKPGKGKVLIQGRNIEELDKVFLKQQISVALQEPFLWNDSIENNIKYAKKNASRNEVVETAALAGVDEFVKSLPQGYETVIGENACKLSEGQKQKIAIARALINKPKILILDEAMSSMDSYSEEKIMSNIRSLPIDIVIVVSHRLSTIMACDSVYFLKSPNNILAGAPRKLIAEVREFSELFAGQIEALSHNSASA